MPDYKEMYLKMARATEAAMRILIQAQQACEELYLTSSEAEEKESKVTEEEDRELLKEA